MKIIVEDKFGWPTEGIFEAKDLAPLHKKAMGSMDEFHLVLSETILKSKELIKDLKEIAKNIEDNSLSQKVDDHTAWISEVMDNAKEAQRRIGVIADDLGKVKAAIQK